MPTHVRIGRMPVSVCRGTARLHDSSHWQWHTRQHSMPKVGMQHPITPRAPNLAPTPTPHTFSLSPHPFHTAGYPSPLTSPAPPQSLIKSLALTALSPFDRCPSQSPNPHNPLQKPPQQHFVSLHPFRYPQHLTSPSPRIQLFAPVSTHSPCPSLASPRPPGPHLMPSPAANAARVAQISAKPVTYPVTATVEPKPEEPATEGKDAKGKAKKGG